MRPGIRNTCPCCGYLTLVEGGGALEVCPICWWEDDDAQLGNPLLRDGANAVSLAEAQIYFMTSGVSDPRFSAHVRPPDEDLAADPAWRPLDGPGDMQGSAIGEPYWLKA